jgi:hypothetical protein
VYPQDEDDLLKEVFLDLLSQHCGTWDRDATGLRTFKGYDSQYLSANERALDLAADFGWIKREEIIR